MNNTNYDKLQRDGVQGMWLDVCESLEGRGQRTQEPGMRELLQAKFEGTAAWHTKPVL